MKLTWSRGRRAVTRDLKCVGVFSFFFCCFQDEDIFVKNYHILRHLLQCASGCRTQNLCRTRVCGRRGKTLCETNITGAIAIYPRLACYGSVFTKAQPAKNSLHYLKYRLTAPLLTDAHCTLTCVATSDPSRLSERPQTSSVWSTCWPPRWRNGNLLRWFLSGLCRLWCFPRQEPHFDSSGGYHPNIPSWWAQIQQTMREVLASKLDNVTIAPVVSSVFSSSAGQRLGDTNQKRVRQLLN